MQGSFFCCKKQPPPSCHRLLPLVPACPRLSLLVDTGVTAGIRAPECWQQGCSDAAPAARAWNCSCPTLGLRWSWPCCRALGPPHVVDAYDKGRRSRRARGSKRPGRARIFSARGSSHVVEARRRLEAVEPSSHLAALPLIQSQGYVLQHLARPVCETTPKAQGNHQLLRHAAPAGLGSLWKRTRAICASFSSRWSRYSAMMGGSGFCWFKSWKNEFLMSSSTDPRRCRVM